MRDKHRNTSDEKIASTDDPPAMIAQQELERILHEELRRLPDQLRAAIVLCELEGLTHVQAARQLGVPASTVSSRVTKARRLLHDRIARRDVAITLAGLTTCFASFATASTQPSSAFSFGVAQAARMYVSGSPVTAIGVSTEVIRVANTVTSAIARTRLLAVTSTVLAIGAVAWATSEISVAPFAAEVNNNKAFVDTFSDPQHRSDGPVRYKGIPVIWKHWPNDPIEVTYESRNFEISSHVKSQFGKLVVSGHGVASAATADYGHPVLSLSDTSVRSQVRLLEGEAVFINPIRNHFAVGPPGYYGIVGDLYAEIRYGGKWQAIVRCETNLVVKGEDVVIQFDAIGDVLSLWAWPTGQEMPKHPLLRVVDTAVPTTNRGDLTIGVVGPTAKAEFYYVHVAEEPIGEGDTKQLICNVLNDRS